MVWATVTALELASPLEVWTMRAWYPSMRAMTNSSPPSDAMSTPRRMLGLCAGFSLRVASSIHVAGMILFVVFWTKFAWILAIANGDCSPSSLMMSLTHCLSTRCWEILCVLTVGGHVLHVPVSSPVKFGVS